MADTGEMTELKSSVVKAYSYDEKTRALKVRFPNGDIHEFSDVGIDKVHTLAGSASPGQFFNERIKGIHQGKKVSS
jgi:hypothetical protein